MTVHKLSAGDGYTYLTRQVASADAPRAGRGLADYYTDSGCPPGRWVGSGAEDLRMSGLVSESNMRALFGSGEHPDEVAIRASMELAGASPPETDRAVRLGSRYPVYAQLPVVQEGVAVRVSELQEQLARDLTPAEAATVRSQEVARQRKAVAGYDLVFTPVKSVSLLWALGDERTRHAVEAAHRAAVADVLAWVEANGAFTRIGAGGRFQVDTRGLVATAFEHFESRAGDPDLHTHVAIANKVRAVLDKADGSPRWLALDGKALFAIGVAASERYNTRVEDEVRERLPVRFVPRAVSSRADARCVREVEGVPEALIDGFSTRRAQILQSYARLEDTYRVRHGHDPSPAVRLQLAQQATLATRAAKPSPRPLSVMCQDWRQRADRLLDGADAQRVLARALQASVIRHVPAGLIDVDGLARSVLAVLASHRSTWSRWNLLAEVERQTRAIAVAGRADRQHLVDTVTGTALRAAETITIPAGISAAGPGGRDLLELSGVSSRDELPTRARRSDGTPVDVHHGTERYTSRTIVDAELDLLDALSEPSSSPSAVLVEDAVAGLQSAGVELGADQQDAARHLVCDAHRLSCLVGPAGSGKTTTLRAAVAAWHAAGRRVVPLAPSAAAAEVLAAELGVQAENLHKYLHDLHARTSDEAGPTLGHGDVLLVDEAGMAGTLRLRALLQYARAVGAQLRLVGDPQQLGAVEAGGAFRLLTAASHSNTAQLTRLRRFSDPAEASALSAIRGGDPSAAEHYVQSGRVHTGPEDELIEQVFLAWRHDVTAGHHALMITADRDHATALNARAHLDRAAHGTIDTRRTAQLRDGTHAGVDDWVLTRTNARLLTTNAGRDFVKNGDRWTITALHPDGSATAMHHEHRGSVHLPASYLRDSAELGYATTVHRAQGSTCDHAHALLTDATAREELYVAASRARHITDLFLIDSQMNEEHPSNLLTPSALRSNNGAIAPPDVESIRRLQAMIARSHAELSATEQLTPVAW